MNEVTDVDEEHGQTSSDIKVDIVVPADDDNDNQTDKTQDTNNLQVALVGDEATLGAADDNIFRGRKKPETIMEWCEGLAAIDHGGWMKSKTGVAGNDPAQDSFPWFASNDPLYVRILWDLSPNDWRIVSFPKRPRDAYDPDEYLQARQIMIKDISEVLLEVAPSESFRVYLGETNQVVKLTPFPLSRELAALWVDAIYAAMYLQNLEDDHNDLLEEQESNENAEEEGEAAEKVDPTKFFELRDKYYEIHPDQIVQEKPYEETSGDIESGGNNNGTGNNRMSVGRGDGRTASKRMSISSMLDFSQIYSSPEHPDELPQSSPQTSEDKQNDQCCIIS